MTTRSEIKKALEIWSWGLFVGLGIGGLIGAPGVVIGVLGTAGLALGPRFLKMLREKPKREDA